MLNVDIFPALAETDSGFCSGFPSWVYQRPKHFDWVQAPRAFPSDMSECWIFRQLVDDGRLILLLDLEGIWSQRSETDLLGSFYFRSKGH